MSPQEREITRRELLAGGLTFIGGILAAACSPRPETRTSQPLSSPEKITSINQLVQLGDLDYQMLISQAIRNGELRFPLPQVPPDGPFLVKNDSFSYTFLKEKRTVPVLNFRIPGGDKVTLFTAPIAGQIFRNYSYFGDNLVEVTIVGQTKFVFHIFTAAAEDKDLDFVSVGTPLFAASHSPKIGKPPSDHRDQIIARSLTSQGPPDWFKFLSLPKDADVVLSIGGSSLAPTMGNLLRAPDGRYGWYVSSDAKTKRLLQDVDQFNRGLYPTPPPPAPTPTSKKL